MTITRIIGGQSVEIELTLAELCRAYDEQKLLNIRFDVENNLKKHLDNDEYLSLFANDDFIQAVAEETMAIMECMGLSFEYALENAIENNKEDYLNEED